VLDALYAPGTRWPRLVREVAAWQGGAYAYGLEALAAARALGGPMHIRRAADVEARAPFDPYHYRIIYQTFTPSGTSRARSRGTLAPRCSHSSTRGSAPRDAS
jgi:hypothetical protein